MTFSNTPNLPPLYEPVILDTVDSVAHEARRQAFLGAEEGTLVWARNQEQQSLPSQSGWRSQDKDFNCAILLRPEYSVEQSLDLLHVANVALLSALAGLLAPGIDLRLRWPDKLVANNGVIAINYLDLDTTQPSRPDWLVVATSVHMEACDHDASVAETSLREEQGDVSVTLLDLLESYSRYFLSWINRWANEGLAPVIRSSQGWRDERQDEVTFELRGERVQGRPEGLGDTGALLLRTTDQQMTPVTLARYLGFDTDMRGAED